MTLLTRVSKSLLVFHCNCLYVVPFLIYSVLNNGVTLPYGFGSFKVTENGAVQ